jgi:hypothetical protein
MDWQRKFLTTFRGAFGNSISRNTLRNTKGCPPSGQPFTSPTLPQSFAAARLLTNGKRFLLPSLASRWRVSPPRILLYARRYQEKGPVRARNIRKNEIEPARLYRKGEID